MNVRTRHGFTLLEMTIVVAIIGFIVGGIVVGRSIITSSRIQTMITDEDSYVTAAANFRQAYQALPGDMANAQSDWGTGTCNGNGDGVIAGNSTQAYESFCFWQHLYLANMFSKQLSGVAGSGGTYNAVPNKNSPLGSIEGSTFYPVWWGTIAADNDHFAGSYGNVMIFGGATSAGPPNGAVLTPDQAASVDAKLDDGSPVTGKIRTYAGGAGTATINAYCATGNSTTSNYNVSDSAPACSLIFLMGL